MGGASSPATMIELASRLAFATAVGAVVGLNRQLAGKPAGLRTHALVSLGAAAAVLTAIIAGGDPAAASRVSQGVIAGVGFIGGGVILHDRRNIHGLPTAATIWLVAAAGLAAGTGLWATASLVAILALLVLVVGYSI